MAEPGNAPDAAASTPSRIYKDLLLLQLATLVFLVDQFTKFLVREFLPYRTSFPAEGFFRISHTHNTGSAFGLFQGQNFPLILVAFIGIGVLILIYRSQRRPSDGLRLSLGLQLGGAAGNLLDRVRLGHVTDFLDVGPWPVFNIADSSIVIGLVLLAWIFLGPQRRRGVDTVGDRSSTSGTSSGANLGDGARWCPVCDGEMQAISKGWRCSTCGVKERVDLPGPNIAIGPGQPLRDTTGESAGGSSAIGDSAPPGSTPASRDQGDGQDDLARDVLREDNAGISGPSTGQETGFTRPWEQPPGGPTQ